MPFESLQNGRYQTVRELGSGSMGEVVLVNDTVIGRQVAIKVMRADPAAYPDTESIRDAVKLFKREAQAIARLEHPNILPLFDFGEEKSAKTVFTYMVMPYCPEGSLADWIKRQRPGRPLPLEEVVYFVDQAADALQYAHDHGVIHQDVKPPNFLLRLHASGQLLPDLLLADFGIARMNSGSTVSTLTTLTAGPRGTPRYMPPEQWEGKPVPASDQYALAVMAYQLLTLRYPFNGEQVLQLMYQHLQRTPEPPSTVNTHLPNTLDAVILRALAKKPAERFPSVRDFAQALRQTLPRGSVIAHPALKPVERMSNPATYPQTIPTVLPGAYSTPPYTPPAQTSASTRFDVSPSTPMPTRPADNVVQPRPAYPENSASFAQQTFPDAMPTQPARPLKTAAHRNILVWICVLLLLVLAGAGGGYSYYVLKPQGPQPKPPVDPRANPYTATMPILRFSDPLSRPDMWQELHYDQLTDGFCIFQQGAYHADSNKTHVYTLCPIAPQQPVTSDMTFEIHMQILHGDCGGFLFRGNFQQGNFYYFDVCFDGHHYLATYNHFALVQQLPTQTSMFPALQQNAQAMITLGMVARGSQFTFFLNGQQIDHITDATYTNGQIALLCFAINDPTEVVFSNARLWTA